MERRNFFRDLIEVVLEVVGWIGGLLIIIGMVAGLMLIVFISRTLVGL